MRPASIVVAIPLAEAMNLFAESTSNYQSHQLETPMLRDLLPHAASMSLHVLLDGLAVNEIDWNIDAYAGWDREHELTSVLFYSSDQTAVGPQILAVTNVSASTHYLKHMRLVLKWRLHTRVSAPRRGRWSAILYVTLKS